MKNPFVSIIFPNLNGGDFLLKTFDSLLSLDYPEDAFEIIMVDNGSTDGSPRLIKNNYADLLNHGKIKLIELMENRGAPAAYNFAIRNARKDYAYILKIDNDIILDKDALTDLVKCAESNSQVGMVGGKVFYFLDKQRLHLIGSRLSPFYGGGIGIGKYKLDNNKYNKDLELDAVNGCMMLVKRTLIDEVGLMDENYFLYFDDLDWGLRAKCKGFRSVYCHKAVAYHNTSQPYKRFQSQRRLYYAIFNSFYFMKKNYSGLNRAIFLIATHIRILRYIFGVILNNNVSRQRELLKTVFNSYFKGLRYLWKRE